MQYTDDNSCPVHTLEELQMSVYWFKSAYAQFLPTVNAQKTKILVQPAPGIGLREYDFTIFDTHLEQVNHFFYLKSIRSHSCTCEKEVENRIRAAHVAFRCLSYRVFLYSDLRISTKLMVYH